MLPRFGDPDIYPSVRFRAPGPPSLHRVPRDGSPASAVLKGPLTSRYPSGQARLPLTQPYRLCARPIRSCGLWEPPGRRPGSLVSRDPHRLSLRRRWQDLPGSWGDPGGRMPCSLTPVGLLAPGRYGAGVLSPLYRYQNDPNDTYLSRLHRTAFGLAVYASQAPLRDKPTQDSLPAGGQPLPGRIHTCRVPYERFPLCWLLPTSLPPFPGFAWRTSGRPGRLPGRAPHRSGLADFPHPALRDTASLRNFRWHGRSEVAPADT